MYKNRWAVRIFEEWQGMRENKQANRAENPFKLNLEAMKNLTLMNMENVVGKYELLANKFHTRTYWQGWRYVLRKKHISGWVFDKALSGRKWKSWSDYIRR